MNKVFESFDVAVNDIFDGSNIMMFSWINSGTPCNLILALYRKGVKDLVVISHNFVPGLMGDHVLSQEDYPTPLLLAGQIKKVITAWPSAAVLGVTSPLIERWKRGEIEIEITSHGTLEERMRAGGSGIAGILTNVGIGTIIEKGKQKIPVNGKEYLLETALRADFGLVRAFKADKLGNLVYRGSQRGANPIIAMASDITIAEVDEIVEVGELDPEAIITPHIFVDRIVKIPQGGIGTREYMKRLISSSFSKEVI